MFEVKVICDSIAPCGKRLTTITSTFPRIILSEVNTHRDRCRNAASSRAIPFIKMRESIRQDPFIPIAWGLEQSGMQAGDAIPPELAELAEQLWLQACESAQRYAKMIHNIGTTYNDLNTVQRPEFAEVKIHKSIPNRLVEPWMWCTQVMSATEWNNFFRLRCHPDAEVHFQKIANMIKDALAASTPIERNGKGEPESWHLPFILPEDWDWTRTEAKDFVDTAMGMLKRISTARCARVSYLTHEGKRDPSKDLELFDRLVQGSGFGHWSAHEHIAEACDTLERSGPFIGWKQFRKEFVLENQAG